MSDDEGPRPPRGSARRARDLLPAPVRTTVGRRLRRLRRPAWRAAVRGAPVSDQWGWDRGDPVDRYYVDTFLRGHRTDVTGRVLEVRDRRYTRPCSGPCSARRPSPWARWGTSATIAFLRGTAAQEVPRAALDVPDPLHPVVVTVRARKQGTPPGEASGG